MLGMIKMPKPKSCSVCCVAMLTGRGFDDTLKLCFAQEPRDLSMSLEQIELVLNQAGLKTLRLDKVPSTTQDNMLIECRHKVKGFWHYIVYDADQKRFLDPIVNSPKIEDYEFTRAIKIKKNPQL